MEQKFNIVKKGYDPEEVDTYIETLEAVVKSYKEKDSAIKNALINAQIAADNIIKNAELEADNTKAKAIELINGITASITYQREYVNNFRNEYNTLLNKYVHQFNEREISSIFSRIDELESYFRRLTYTDKTVPKSE